MSKLSKILTGVLLISVGLFICILPAFRDGEKPEAIYLFGHWFDIIWEMGLPCIGIGMLICMIGVFYPQSRSMKNLGVAEGIQIVIYGAFLLTTIWTFEVYRYYLFVYWPIGYLWEQVLPWGRDRDQIASAIFVWIPLIGSVTYSLFICLLIRIFTPHAKS